MKPLFMWAGGKTRLIKKYKEKEVLPDSFDKYIEPFVGAGAMFIWAYEQNPNASFVLNDSNESIMGIYRAIKKDAEAAKTEVEEAKKRATEATTATASGADTAAKIEALQEQVNQLQQLQEEQQAAAQAQKEMQQQEMMGNIMTSPAAGKIADNFTQPGSPYGPQIQQPGTEGEQGNAALPNLSNIPTAT